MLLGEVISIKFLEATWVKYGVSKAALAKKIISLKPTHITLYSRSTYETVELVKSS